MKKFLALGVVSLLAAGCGEKEQDEENASNLIGTWVGECETRSDDGGDDDGANLIKMMLQDDQNDGDDQNSDGDDCQGDECSEGDHDDEDDPFREKAEKMEITFAESSFEMEMTSFSTTNCAADTGFRVMRASADYKTGADAASETDVPGASPIDVTWTKVEMKLTDEDLVKKMNEYGVCGTIELDKYFDFSQCKFDDEEGDDEEGDDDKDDGGPQIGKTFYTIFSVPDPGNVFFWGDEDDEDNETFDASTPDKRPKGLENSGLTKK